MTDTSIDLTADLRKENDKLRKEAEEYRRRSERYTDLYIGTQQKLTAAFKLIVDGIDSGEFPHISAQLQSKIQRQKIALNSLNKRVRGQRLHLRYINEQGRQLTPEEWAEAKVKYPEALEYTEI